jgi:TetR/AcrR family transcriptional regulator, mexJK operon transcriptional repressor
MLVQPSVESAKRRPGRPSLTNEELLDKALDLFLELGFERTSIEAICQAAGMAKRTVYARYGDKTSLFKAALQRAIAEWIVPIDRLRAAEERDLEASLLAIGRLLVANVISPAGLRLLRLTNAESARMPDVGASNVQLGTQPTIDFLADLFARRAGIADAAEARLAGQAFLDLVVSGPALTAAWGVPVDCASVERHTRYAVRLFLHGLLAVPAPAAGLDEALAALDEARAKLLRIRNGPG